MSEEWTREELYREIEYQVEQYRHYRSEAARFLRIIVAAVGILGAAFSAFQQFISIEEGFSSVSPSTAYTVGTDLNSLLSSSLPIEVVIAGEVITQFILLTTFVAIVSILTLTVYFLPRNTYEALRIRDVENSPQMVTDGRITDYESLVDQNRSKIKETESALEGIYTTIQNTLWAIGYVAVVYISAFWLESGSAMLSLVFGYGLVWGFRLRRSSQPPAYADIKPGWFDGILLISLISPLLIFWWRPAVISSEWWLVVLYSPWGVVGAQLLNQADEDRKFWLITRTLFLVLLAMVFGVMILFASSTAPAYYQSLGEILILLSAHGVLYLSSVTAVQLCRDPIVSGMDYIGSGLGSLMQMR